MPQATSAELSKIVGWRGFSKEQMERAAKDLLGLEITFSTTHAEGTVSLFRHREPLSFSGERWDEAARISSFQRLTAAQRGILAWWARNYVSPQHAKHARESRKFAEFCRREEERIRQRFEWRRRRRAGEAC